MGSSLSFWGKVKARHLQPDVYAFTVFVVIFIISTIWYVNHPEGLIGEFQMQISTSLLATIFISVFDFYTKFRSFENKEFLESLYEFGIHNLHFNKQEVLERLIRDADEQIWISGYRLILTKRISKDLFLARKRGVKLVLLLCPPWCATHDLVYDDIEATLERYIGLLHSFADPDQTDLGSVTIRFIDKPLFNDTYLVDNTIVSSPYMHNKDIAYGVMSAVDFFTYEVSDKYRLYQLFKDEYEALYSDAPYEIGVEEARAILDEINAGGGDTSYNEKAEIFRKHLRSTGKKPRMISDKN